MHTRAGARQLPLRARRPRHDGPHHDDRDQAVAQRVARSLAFIGLVGSRLPNSFLRCADAAVRAARASGRAVLAVIAAATAPGRGFRAPRRARAVRVRVSRSAVASSPVVETDPREWTVVTDGH